MAPRTPADIRKFEDLGTRSFPLEQGIGEAINFHEGIGSKRKQERIGYLKNYWATRVQSIPKVKLHTSLNLSYSCAICGVSIDGMTPGQVASCALGSSTRFTPSASLGKHQLRPCNSSRLHADSGPGQVSRSYRGDSSQSITASSPRQGDLQGEIDTLCPIHFAHFAKWVGKHKPTPAAGRHHCLISRVDAFKHRIPTHGRAHGRARPAASPRALRGRAALRQRPLQNRHLQRCGR